MASLVSAMNSKSVPRRRYLTSHANVRSTTRRRGWMRMPSGALWAVVTFHPQYRRTQSMNRRVNPASGITSRAPGRDEPLAAAGPLSPRRTHPGRRGGWS
jgi:hypothetical protein